MRQRNGFHNSCEFALKDSCGFILTGVEAAEDNEFASAMTVLTPSALKAGSGDSSCGFLQAVERLRVMRKNLFFERAIDSLHALKLL